MEPEAKRPKRQPSAAPTLLPSPGRTEVSRFSSRAASPREGVDTQPATQPREGVDEPAAKRPKREPSHGRTEVSRSSRAGSPRESPPTQPPSPPSERPPPPPPEGPPTQPPSPEGDCDKVLPRDLRDTYVEITNPYVNEYQVYNQRMVRLNDEEYAVFGNFTFSPKDNKPPFFKHNNGYQLISLSTAYSTFNTLLQESFDLDIPRVCHVFQDIPQFYVTEDGFVTQGAGATSIFYFSRQTTFQPAVVLDINDIVTDFRLLKTGSGTSYVVYCAVKVGTWFPVDLSQMWMNPSAKKLLFNYLRPKERPGMATMANYMYTRTKHTLDEFPAWVPGEYERNASVKKDDKFYTATRTTNKVPPEHQPMKGEDWRQIYPGSYLEYTFHLPAAVEKLKFPAWTKVAHKKGDIVYLGETLYRAEEPTDHSPPHASWKRIDPSKGLCTGKESMISYALFRADTNTFMGGADRPWKIALGKANWFDDHKPGQFVQVSMLVDEPHWMYA